MDEFYDPVNPRSVGGVNHRYRIAKTELTAGQWAEFANAYLPYYQGSANDLRDFWVRYDDAAGRFVATPGKENLPVQVQWRLAATYANWLHNDKAIAAWAFENGAYDISTFGVDADGNYTDQRTPNPDAKFWIPTEDEWIKAGYWNPDLQRYMAYPDNSDDPVYPGLPGVGETSFGIGVQPDLWPDVGSYSDTQSPWGLFDVSGGQSEWTTTWAFGEPTAWGTNQRDNWTDFDDLLNFNYFVRPPDNTIPTLRLASTIPSTPIGAIGVGAVYLQRRTRCR